MHYNILLIGNGAREHRIGESLKKSKHEVDLYVIGKALNPGLSALATQYFVGDYMNHEFVVSCVNNLHFDFAFIGPDDPIAEGLVDTLESHGIRTVAPKKITAQLESSKAFTRNLLEKYGIAGNPKFRIFYENSGMLEYMHELGGQFVVKYDALKGGKGVKVMGDQLKNVEEGYEYACECLSQIGKVVIEEKLIGQEFSLMSFSDGTHLAHMPVVQDHKRAFENDLGPNTGGMGSYSDASHSLPFLSESDIEAAKIMTAQVQKAIFDETGVPFVGIMYGGFIAVKDGIRLIEYNARFGDPEVMNVLTLLKTDFVDICTAMLNGTLDTITVEFENLATVCKYVVPNGYPEQPQKGGRIEVRELPDNVHLYYGSVSDEGGSLLLGTSRAIAFVATGDMIQDASARVDSGLTTVSGPVFFRKDIGTRESIEKKIIMMKTIRPST